MASSPAAMNIRMLLILVVLLSPTTARGQQPFVTDDADVTGKRKLHFELRSAFDLLQPASYPNLKQITANFELDYGLFDHVEVGISPPLIAIFNATGSTPRTPVGIGDTNLSIKYNFLRERNDSRHPAMAVQLNVELATGDVKNQLGSGLTDVWLNGIAQKALTGHITLRINSGILFAGNTTTGAIGIRTRGQVFTSGVSCIRTFTPRLQLGAELTGALTTRTQLTRGQLQAMMGGNYQLREGLTLDFGVVGGHFQASPRTGAVLGVSIDF
jgi:hypothetical protein